MALPETCVVIDPCGFACVGPAADIRGHFEQSKTRPDVRILSFKQGSEQFMQDHPDEVLECGVGLYTLDYGQGAKGWLGVSAPAYVRSVQSVLRRIDQDEYAFWDHQERKRLDDYEAFEAAVESLPCCQNFELWNGPAHSPSCPRNEYSEIRRSFLEAYGGEEE